MELEMVLNEFSLKTPVSDISTARQLMSELINALRQATANGVQRILRTSDEIISLQLANNRSEEHTSELQSRETISYAVFCLKKKKNTKRDKHNKKHTNAYIPSTTRLAST